MLNLFATKIALGLAGALVVGGVIYVVNDYITIKSDYRVVLKTVDVLEHRTKAVDRVMLSVEKQQNAYFVRQNKALLEMDKQGYLTTRDGLTPCWMFAGAANDGKSQCSKQFGG